MRLVQLIWVAVPLLRSYGNLYTLYELLLRLPPPALYCQYCNSMCSSFHQGSVGKGKSGVSKGSAASSGAKGDKDDESGLPYAVIFLAGVSEIPITSM